MRLTTRITALALAATLSVSCTLTTGRDAKVSAATERLVVGVCDLLPPITYDAELDTAETKAQIRHHNAGRNAFCNPPTIKEITQ